MSTAEELSTQILDPIVDCTAEFEPTEGSNEVVAKTRGSCGDDDGGFDFNGYLSEQERLSDSEGGVYAYSVCEIVTPEVAAADVDSSYVYYATLDNWQVRSSGPVIAELAEATGANAIDCTNPQEPSD